MGVEGIIPTRLKTVPAQQAYLRSEKRFNVVPAGRRSGKSMSGKLRARKRALSITHEDGRVLFGAPTHRQAKRIFWKHVKRMFKEFTVGKPLDSELSLTLCTGTVVEVAGLDVPERFEGAPLDHVLLDEYADMKKSVWYDHIRPMLAERGGTADFTGTPEGRNHYYELAMLAEKDPEWGLFTWTSAAVLPPAEIARLIADLDPLTYDQECNASFVNFEGRAYYAFERATHVQPTAYDVTLPIALCLDFNAKPGNCSIVQEHFSYGTQVIGEVFINRYSNTPEVVQAFLSRFSGHQGNVLLYGDPAGNQHKSSNVRGTDWDLVREALRPVFGSRLKWRVDSSAPGVKDSVNALNARISSGAFRVDPCCEWMIKDLEGTERDSAGAIVKKKSGKKDGDLLTHLTDGLRYYAHRCFPIATVFGRTTPL